MRLPPLLFPLALLLVASCEEKKAGTNGAAGGHSEAAAPALGTASPGLQPTISLPQLESRAAAGDARATAILAIKYSEGDGVIVDTKKSFSFAKAAAEANHPLGLYAMAMAYDTGSGVERDEDRGKQLAAKTIAGLQELALTKDEWAQLSLGFAYGLGLGVAKDQKKASEWFEKAATQGLAIAQTFFGAASEDAQKAIALYEKAAAQGYAGAFVNLGEAYRDGAGVPKDEKKAANYLQKAADQGDARGQHRLGEMYSGGMGVALDKRKAVEWYARAAEQGFADAQDCLGVMYSNGEGVLKDKKKAIEWYEKAASQGNIDAQVNLAAAYEGGDGVEKDDKKAADWYEKAAVQGDDAAQYAIAILYDQGIGRPKDEGKAFAWFQKAADQGSAKAEWTVGVFYRNGVGVAKDEHKAAEWIEKAASHGSSSAQEYLSGRTPPVNEARPDLKRMLDYLVIIEGKAGKGSGAIIRTKGGPLLITNAHVLSGNENITFRLLDSTALSIIFENAGIARRYDLAILSLNFDKGGLDVMDQVDKNVSLGDEVVVLGNSEGSGVATEIRGKVTGIGPELIEVDAKFVAGNSGSPIIHVKSGQVIGIATYAVIPKLDRLTKDSKFKEIRRFGYRIDTVPEWQYPPWSAFQQEAKTIADIERKSQYLITLLRDIYAGGSVNGHLHQGDGNPLARYVAAYLLVRDAPPRPLSTPRPVRAQEIDAQLSGQPIPAETYNQFMQRRKNMANQGLLGPERLARDPQERADDQRQAELLRGQRARELKREAEEQARVDAEAERRNQQEKELAQQKQAKETLLRQVTYEATSDVKALTLETFTEYHRKKLNAEIELRGVLQREFEKLINIQDSRRTITLP